MSPVPLGSNFSYACRRISTPDREQTIDYCDRYDTTFYVQAITGFTTGFVLAAQSFYQLGEKGLSAVTGVLVGKAMITENLEPIFNCFYGDRKSRIFHVRELGTMRVTEQIDALRSMAINPYAYLIAPRFIAGIFMIPLLTLFSAVMGIMGGYLIAITLFHMSSATYFDPMQIHITLFDLATGSIKAFIFGALMVTVCCYKGMKTTGVPQALEKPRHRVL